MEYLMIAVFMCIALTTIVCGGINTVLSQNDLKIEVRPNPDRGWHQTWKPGPDEIWRAIPNSNGDWVPDTTKNLESLLMRSAEVINDTLRVPFNGEIKVENHGDGPMVRSREALDKLRALRQDGKNIRTAIKGPFCIFLDTGPRFTNDWRQIVYQFAHEFCHILTAFEDVTHDNPNAWFHEAICELASGYVLLEWQVSGYPASDYWEEQVKIARDDQEVRSYWEDEKGNISVSLNEWLEKHEDQPQKQLDSYGWWNAGEETQKWRNHFMYVARVLLPIFIEDPSGWNAIRKLPASRGMLKEYLQDWHKQVDDADKEFVKKVASKFGYTVE